MSNALFESPVASSQLYFTWSENSGLGETVAEGLLEDPQPLQSTESRAAEKVDCNSTHGKLSIGLDRRIEKPVRMGEVMIKLLKRYGITDQEIEEGMADYARKSQQSLAS